VITGQVDQRRYQTNNFQRTTTSFSNTHLNTISVVNCFAQTFESVSNLGSSKYLIYPDTAQLERVVGLINSVNIKGMELNEERSDKGDKIKIMIQLELLQNY